MLWSLSTSAGVDNFFWFADQTLKTSCTWLLLSSIKFYCWIQKLLGGPALAHGPYFAHPCSCVSFFPRTREVTFFQASVFLFFCISSFWNQKMRVEQFQRPSIFSLINDFFDVNHKYVVVQKWRHPPREKGKNMYDSIV